ncbi:Uncharacterized protein EbC_23640 [Erwinia billingiae Eb661]|uniref:Uncharacterized protein n=1 Tax=Erwinia billingiae (strain Eb661) TaxID=634500 RepID=D8MST8_ERWBE|nr:Uncharacterized protein EbC_23640 [Erwinia billingiae Eb661]
MKYVFKVAETWGVQMNLTQMTWFSTWTFSALFWTSAVWAGLLMHL